MENGPFEDVFPIENSDIPASYVSLPEGINIQGGFPDPCFLLEDFFVLGRVNVQIKISQMATETSQVPKTSKVRSYLP